MYRKADCTKCAGPAYVTDWGVRDDIEGDAVAVSCQRCHATTWKPEGQ